MPAVGRYAFPQSMQQPNAKRWPHAPAAAQARVPWRPSTTGGELCPVEWGSVLEIWEGHAADPETRWRGSSGGAATALAAFAMESGAAAGAVHVRQARDNALLNESTISRSNGGTGLGGRIALRAGKSLRQAR